MVSNAWREILHEEICYFEEVVGFVTDSSHDGASLIHSLVLFRLIG